MNTTSIDRYLSSTDTDQAVIGIRPRIVMEAGQAIEQILTLRERAGNPPGQFHIHITFRPTFAAARSPESEYCP